MSCADEGIGRPLYSAREFELDFTLRVITFLRSLGKLPPQGEGTVLDIGANMGVISIGMLHTGQFKRAVAVEPEPSNFSLLEHNVQQNKLEGRVICLPYAVSDQKGEVQFELCHTNHGDHRVRSGAVETGYSTELFQESGRPVISVEAVTLDQLVEELPESTAQDIDLVWVDIQGYEGYGFLGGKGLLSKGIPVVAEIWPYGVKRSGMSQEQFCNIAESIWSSYWVWREGSFVRYPISVLGDFFAELGDEGDFDNVVFV